MSSIEGQIPGGPWGPPESHQRPEKNFRDLVENMELRPRIPIPNSNLRPGIDGTQAYVGAMIAYPWRQGSLLRLFYGEVTKIEGQKISIHRSDGKNVAITRAPYVVI